MTKKRTKKKLPPPEDDGLHIPEVGDWSAHKHHFLWRYIDAFTVSMKEKWKLHYVDLYAGAGITKLKNSGKLEWGSPLLALQAPKPFHHLHLCEKNRQCFEALSQRVARFGTNVTLYNRDANTVIRQIVDSLPSDSLSLAFLDPYGLNPTFEALSLLGTKRVDLIIYFPDKIDIARNIREYYYGNTQSKLDKYLGMGSAWRKEVDKASSSKWPEIIRSLYFERIGTLGYSIFDAERIEGRKIPLYQLVFCSKNPMGGRLWRRVCSVKPDSQRTFLFE